MKKSKKGFFISFEGGEATGKTTQIKMLSSWLKNNRVPFLITREPGGTKLSEDLRKIILSSRYKLNTEIEVMLLMSSRIDHLNEVIIPALNSGKVVISDRYVDSTAVYQGYYGKFGINNVYNMHKKYLNNILPNLTFFLDTKINLISKRLTKRKLKNKYDIIDDKFNSTIRKGYLKIAKNKKRFIIINSSLPINEIQYKIIKIISNKIKNYGIRISQKNKL